MSKEIKSPVGAGLKEWKSTDWFKPFLRFQEILSNAQKAIQSGQKLHLLHTVPTADQVARRIRAKEKAAQARLAFEMYQRAENSVGEVN